MQNYLEVNKESWNKRLDTHLESDFYDLPGFLKGKSSLNSIELELLGDVKNKSILHLQCHFGQDSISLSRLGAKVSGIDLSDQSIATAQKLAKDCDTDTQFICSDVYGLPNALNEKFDIVFTSYGTISWLPDLDLWAQVVSHFLKPEGKFVFVEFHPVVWMFDDDLQKVGYNYFNEKPIVEEESGSYADREADLKNQYVCWNHSISETVNNLIKNQLRIESLNEYDYAPYNAVNNMEEFEKGKYRVKHFGNKAPLVYSILATKNS